MMTAISGGAMHGYSIAEMIALYPALHRLELKGLLSSEWGVFESNRRAKFYRLIAAGRRRLAEASARWDRMAAAIARVMQTA